MKLLKVKQVAELLNVTQQTVYNWISEGKIKARRISNSIRVTEESLEKLGEENGVDYSAVSSLRDLPEEEALRIIQEYLSDKFEIFENKDVWNAFGRR